MAKRWRASQYLWTSGRFGTLTLAPRPSHAPRINAHRDGSADQPIRPRAQLQTGGTGDTHSHVDPLPDPSSLARDELTSLIKELVTREQEVPNTRHVLHGQIDALRRELVNRLRDEGNDIIFGGDILGTDSAGVREPRTPRPQRGSDGVALPEPRESNREPNAPSGRQPPNAWPESSGD
jgi:hypothetical protein